MTRTTPQDITSAVVSRFEGCPDPRLRELMEGGLVRHPWRPAHIHMIVRAPGFRTLTTHLFDAESDYLDSDAVFAVKPSLLRRFEARPADDPERPDGVDGEWFSVENDLVLARN